MNKKLLFLILAIIFLSPLAASADVPEMITNIELAFITIGSSIVVIGWIIAGILYLTSTGNPEKVKIAKTALVAAVIGTAIIVLSLIAEPTISELLGV